MLTQVTITEHEKDDEELSVLLTVVEVNGVVQVALVDTGGSRDLITRKQVGAEQIYTEEVAHTHSLNGVKFSLKDFLYKNVTLNNKIKTLKMYIVDSLPCFVETVVSYTTMGVYELKVTDEHGDELKTLTRREVRNIVQEGTRVGSNLLLSYVSNKVVNNKHTKELNKSLLLQDEQELACLLSFTVRSTPDRELFLEQIPGWEPSVVPEDVFGNKVVGEPAILLIKQLRKVAWDPRSGKFIKGYQHEIKIKEGTTPIFQYYKEKHGEKSKYRDVETKQMQDYDFVEDAPWDSRWNSQPVMVAKPGNQGWRMCANLAPINKYVEAETFPIMTEGELMEEIGDKKCFTVLDCAKGFWQVLLAKESRKYTTFTVSEGRKQYKRLPMGLKDASFVFQRIMNAILGDIVHLYIYIDDLIIATNTVEENRVTLTEVLRRMDEHNIQLRIEKCMFFESTVTYLGRKVSNEGVSVTDEALLGIKRLKPPESKDDVRSVYQSLSWWSRFIPNFSIITEPISKLTKAQVKFEWGLDQQTAWDRVMGELELKRRLTTPDYNGKLVLYVDACLTGLGAALFNKIGDELVPVAFASTKLQECHFNYSPTELEGLALIFGITKYEKILSACVNPFTIYTDHKPLLGIWRKLDGNSTDDSVKYRRLRRWWSLMNAFNFNLEYVPGKFNYHADSQSRMANEISKWLQFVDTYDRKAENIYLGTMVPTDYNNNTVGIKKEHNYNIVGDDNGNNDSKNIYNNNKKDSFVDFKLNPVLFSFINNLMGTLDVDLFAAKHNCQLPTFITKEKNSFLLDWNMFRGWANPPFIYCTKFY
eukprot:Pgem_evm2s19228